MFSYIQSWVRLLSLGKYVPTVPPPPAPACLKTTAALTLDLKCKAYRSQKNWDLRGQTANLTPCGRAKIISMATTRLTLKWRHYGNQHSIWSPVMRGKHSLFGNRFQNTYKNAIDHCFTGILLLLMFVQHLLRTRICSDCKPFNN